MYASKLKLFILLLFIAVGKNSPNKSQIGQKNPQIGHNVPNNNSNSINLQAKDVPIIIETRNQPVAEPLSQEQIKVLKKRAIDVLKIIETKNQSVAEPLSQEPIKVLKKRARDIEGNHPVHHFTKFGKQKPSIPTGRVQEPIKIQPKTALHSFDKQQPIYKNSISGFQAKNILKEKKPQKVTLKDFKIVSTPDNINEMLVQISNEIVTQNLDKKLNPQSNAVFEIFLTSISNILVDIKRNFEIKKLLLNFLASFKHIFSQLDEKVNIQGTKNWVAGIDQAKFDFIFKIFIEYVEHNDQFCRTSKPNLYFCKQHGAYINDVITAFLTMANYNKIQFKYVRKSARFFKDETKTKTQVTKIYMDSLITNCNSFKIEFQKHGELHTFKTIIYLTSHLDLITKFASEHEESLYNVDIFNTYFNSVQKLLKGLLVHITDSRKETTTYLQWTPSIYNEFLASLDQFTIDFRKKMTDDDLLNSDFDFLGNFALIQTNLKENKKNLPMLGEFLIEGTKPSDLDLIFPDKKYNVNKNVFVDIKTEKVIVNNIEKHFELKKGNSVQNVLIQKTSVNNNVLNAQFEWFLIKLDDFVKTYQKRLNMISFYFSLSNDLRKIKSTIKDHSPNLEKLEPGRVTLSYNQMGLLNISLARIKIWMDMIEGINEQGFNNRPVEELKVAIRSLKSWTLRLFFDGKNYNEFNNKKDVTFYFPSCIFVEELNIFRCLNDEGLIKTVQKYILNEQKLINKLEKAGPLIKEFPFYVLLNEVYSTAEKLFKSERMPRDLLLTFVKVLKKLGPVRKSIKLQKQKGTKKQVDLLTVEIDKSTELYVELIHFLSNNNTDLKNEEENQFESLLQNAINKLKQRIEKMPISENNLLDFQNSNIKLIVKTDLNKSYISNKKTIESLFQKIEEEKNRKSDINTGDDNKNTSINTGHSFIDGVDIEDENQDLEFEDEVEDEIKNSEELIVAIKQRDEKIKGKKETICRNNHLTGQDLNEENDFEFGDEVQPTKIDTQPFEIKLKEMNQNNGDLLAQKKKNQAMGKQAVLLKNKNESSKFLLNLKKIKEPLNDILIDQKNIKVPLNWKLNKKETSENSHRPVEISQKDEKVKKQGLKKKINVLPVKKDVEEIKKETKESQFEEPVHSFNVNLLKNQLKNNLLSCTPENQDGNYLNDKESIQNYLNGKANGKSRIFVNKNTDLNEINEDELMGFPELKLESREAMSPKYSTEKQTTYTHVPFMFNNLSELNNFKGNNDLQVTNLVDDEVKPLKKIRVVYVLEIIACDKCVNDQILQHFLNSWNE